MLNETSPSDRTILTDNRNKNCDPLILNPFAPRPRVINSNIILADCTENQTYKYNFLNIRIVLKTTHTAIYEITDPAVSLIVACEDL